ncbi:hypothetical protein AAY473_036426 [Plecturocebus cupreus]
MLRRELSSPCIRKRTCLRVVTTFFNGYNGEKANGEVLEMTGWKLPTWFDLKGMKRACSKSENAESQGLAVGSPPSEKEPGVSLALSPRHDGLLQHLPLRFKRFSCLCFLISWDYRHVPRYPAKF